MSLCQIVTRYVPLRYRMRTLFIAITAIALMLGWLGKLYRDKRHELAVVQCLVDWGATVGFDYGDGARKPRGATWLSILLGDEFFARVDQVTCHSLDDERMKAFRELPSVTTIDASGSAVTDNGLAQLRELASITDLNLERTGVTDAGMSVLATLPHLKTVCLRETAVTGNGLASLSGMQNVSSLSVSQDQLVTGLVLSNLPQLGGLVPLLGGSVDLQDLGGGADASCGLNTLTICDASSIRLVRLPQLKELRIVNAPANVYFEGLGGLEKVECVGNANLDTVLEQVAASRSIDVLIVRGGSITARGAALLNELRSLTDLDLSRTNTDDTIAPALATLVQLESLDLSFTHVTDESLVHLMGLRKLWKLDLGGTLVSKGGVETIQRALPDTSVQWAWAQ